MQQYTNYAKHIGADEYLLKWVSTVLKNELKREIKTTEEVEHILDYMVQCNKKVERMSYAQAKKLTEAWDKTQQKKGNNIEESPSDTEVVLDFKDGFKIVKLIGENAYKREGFLMRHCVGGYYGRDVEIYSLRDKDNIPHATMEKNQQIKGKGNGDIHPKYVDYVVKFLEYIGMTVGDSEMKHLGYVNLEQLIKDLETELSKDTKALLYQGKYYPTSKGIDGLKDSEDKPIRTLELLDYFPMFEEVEEDDSFSLKLALNIPMLASGFVEFVKNKVSKKKGIKEKIFDTSKDSELISAEDNATVSAEDNATVSAGNYAKVSAGNYAKVSAGYNAKVSAGYNATVSAEDNATVSAGKDSIIVAETESKAKGKTGTILLITKRKYEDNRYKIIDWKAEMIDGKIIKEDTWYKLENGKLIEVK